MPAWSPEKVHRKIGDMVTDLMANADWMKDRFNNDFTPTIQTATAFPVTSAYRPDLPEVSRERYDRVQDFGPRWNENSGGRPMTSLKGYGWLGLMPTHSGGVMSEFSASAPVDRSDLSKKYKFPVLMGGFDIHSYKFANQHDVRAWGKRFFRNVRYKWHFRIIRY